MIAVARAEDIRDVWIAGDGFATGKWLTVPAIKLPAGVSWSADACGAPLANQIHFEHEGRRITTLWHGPHTVGGQTLYFIDAPRAVLQKLRDQLGAANVAPLIRALRLKPALRAYCRAQGFSLIRNSAGKPVGVLPPIVICGNNPVDLDGDELDDADELLDLEDSP